MANSLPDQISARAAGFGQRIRLARLRRKIAQADLASRAGISRSTLIGIEKGSLDTGLGAYLRVLWVLGLDGDLDLIADPGLDREGLALSIDPATKRARVRRAADNDF